MEPLHSAFAVTPLIKENAHKISEFADANIRIHMPVFNQIIKKMVNDAVATASEVNGAMATTSEVNGVAVTTSEVNGVAATTSEDDKPPGSE